MSRIIPPGRAGLIVLAAVITPVVLKKCRRITKRVGEGMMQVGEKLRDYANEGTSNNGAAPNADVKEANPATAATATTKVKASTKGADLNAASPTGQEEMEAHIAADVKGDTAVPTAPPRKKRAAETKTKPDQPLNPKRTAVTPPKNASAKGKSKSKKTPGESN
jgi:hypothetical protein